MSMPIKLRLLLWMYNNFKKPDISRMSVSQMRKFSDEYVDKRGIFDGPPISMFKVTDQQISGSEIYIPIRVYQPVEGDNLPVIVFFHGGGFVMGTLETHDKVCRRISRDSKAIVVSVDYRLAPEHKYPAAHVDCYDATCWVAANCKSFGGDPTRLVVMGDSAGGNLATVTAMKSRDFGGPSIAYQVLVYPCTDARLVHPSIDFNGKGYILTKDMMNWFLDKYKEREGQDLESYMSPYLAKDLSNMPPALIQVAQYDPLYSEGKAYAERLKAFGNRVQLTEYAGLIHTYFTMPTFSKKCLTAYEEIQRVLHTELFVTKFI